MNVNKAIILGRITRAPEFKMTPSGVEVTNISIATNNTYKGKDGNKVEEVEYHNIVAFGNVAKIIQQYVVKGQILYVEGRIKNNIWEDQNGVKKNRTQIIAESIQMGPSPKPKDTQEEIVIE